MKENYFDACAREFVLMLRNRQFKAIVLFLRLVYFSLSIRELSDLLPVVPQKGEGSREKNFNRVVSLRGIFPSCAQPEWIWRKPVPP